MLDEHILQYVAEALEADPDILENDGSASPKLETEIFLMSMEELLTPEEFSEIVIEGATQLELYGIITDATIVEESYSIANEASYNKKVVIKQTKDSVMDKIQKRTCIRIEQEQNSSLWLQYHKGRTMMIDAREKMYKKNMSKARSLTMQSMQNSARKASAMSNKSGATIIERMDKQIAKMNGRH